MNALTLEELDNIRKVTGNQQLNGKIFNLTPGQWAPAELSDVYLANFVVRNSDYAKHPERLKRILRIIDYLTKNNLTGSEPIMYYRVIELSKYLYQDRDQIGDFSWMIKQPEFTKTLFVFNDEEEHYKYYWEFRAGNKFYYMACESGPDSASVRPQQCETTPRSYGIPTNKNGVGYSDLSVVKAELDKALTGLKIMLMRGDYDRVAMSMDDDGLIADEGKNLSLEVRKYITDGIYNVVKTVNES